MDNNFVECENCGWKGKLEECVWRYDSIEGVRATPYCPKCGSDHFFDIDQERVSV